MKKKPKGYLILFHMTTFFKQRYSNSSFEVLIKIFPFLTSNAFPPLPSKATKISSLKIFCMFSFASLSKKRGPYGTFKAKIVVFFSETNV